MTIIEEDDHRPRPGRPGYRDWKRPTIWHKLQLAFPWGSAKRPRPDPVDNPVDDSSVATPRTRLP